MGASRVTDATKRDFRTVLEETGERFDTRQRDIHKGLIAEAVRMVAADPVRGGSWDRGGIVPGLRALHLDTAAGRRGAAAHTLYSAAEHQSGGSASVVILRLLHESMEPRLHIARSAWD